MIAVEHIKYINEYYKSRGETVRDFEIAAYENDLLKIGIAWSMSYSYDEALIFKGLSLVDAGMSWTSNVGEDFIYLMDKNDSEFMNIYKKYRFEYEYGRDLVKIKVDNGYCFYFSAEEVTFIDRKISASELLAIK